MNDWTVRKNINTITIALLTDYFKLLLWTKCEWFFYDEKIVYMYVFEGEGKYQNYASKYIWNEILICYNIVVWEFVNN